MRTNNESIYNGSGWQYFYMVGGRQRQTIIYPTKEISDAEGEKQMQAELDALNSQIIQGQPPLLTRLVARGVYELS